MAVDLLTSLTPIVPGREADLRRALAALPTGDGSPFARVPGTHVARWVVLEYFGKGDPVLRRPLRPALLLFSAAFDGPVEPWLWGLRAGLGPTAEAVWSHCSRWPGAAEGTSFAHWLLEHRLHINMPFVAHPEATVGEILHGLDCRERLINFAVRNQGRAPADLRRAFEAVFGRAAASRR